MRALLSILLLACSTARGAALFASASSQYGERTNWTAITTYPCTIHVVFNLTTTNAAHTMVSINAETSGERFQIDTDNAGVLSARAVNSGGSGGAASHVTLSRLATNVTYRATGLFIASDHRRLYINGTVVATNSTGITVANLDRIILGSRRASGGTLANYHDGMLGAVAIWNVILNDQDIAALGNESNPASPLRIGPAGSLKFYAPLAYVSATGTPDVLGAIVPWGTAPSVTTNPKLTLP